MKYTRTYLFKKPESGDTININDINDAIDGMDQGLYEVQKDYKNLKEIFTHLTINAGNSNAEIVAARRDNIADKTYTSLPDRLNDYTSRLQQKPTCYNSVADMMADKNLKDGMTATTLGYYSPNDSGGGTYKISEENNKLTYTLIEENNFKNVAQYGIVPNSGVDVAPMLEELVNNSLLGQTLYFPSGTYIFRSPIHFASNKAPIFKGVHNNETTRESTDYPNRSTKFVFLGGAFENNTALTFSVPCSIEGIVFISDSYVLRENRLNVLKQEEDVYTETINFNNVNGIKIKDSTTVKNCEFYGFSGKALIGAAWDKITDCFFENCNVGIEQTLDGNINNCRFNMCSRCMNVTGSANIISNLRGDSIAGYGIYITGQGNIITDINIDFCLYASFYVNSVCNTITGKVDRSGIYGVNHLNCTYDKSSGIAFGELANNNKVDVMCNFFYSLDDDHTSPMCPIYAIGVTGTSQGNDIRIQTNIATNMATLSLENFKKTLGVDTNGVFTGAITYKGKSYKCYGVSPNYYGGNIVVDKEMPYIDTPAVISGTPHEVGIIAYHSTLGYYLSYALKEGGWIKIADK